MKDETYDKMIQTPDGNVSSTRIMAWDTWMFLKKLIIIFLVVMVIFAGLVAWLEFKVPGELIGYILTAFVAIVLLLFIAIYAPKQFSKASEIKGIIGVAQSIVKK